MKTTAKIAATVAISATIVLSGCIGGRQSDSPAIPRDENIEKQIETILKGMSLDDKVGQMLQLDLSKFGKWENGVWKLDVEKMETVIRDYKVGSFLNAPGKALDVENWRLVIPKIQELSMKHIGIPTIFGLDNNHGSTYVAGGTLFPQPIAIAASFNTELARTMAESAAYESRAADCPWVFNPTLDLGRDPRWPRIWESFGEDATVNAQMAKALVKGYQGDDPNHLGKFNVAVSAKHYFCYGAPFSGKDRTPAYVSPSMLREKYFAPFKAAVEAGALNIMVNSGSINGVPVHASWEYLTKWLKQDLNWDGMILTDWADIKNLYTREKVAKDKKEAVKLAINAGVDMSMDPYSTDFCDLLKELVNEGEVPMSRIDDAVRRILRLKIRIGLLDVPDTDVSDYPEFGGEAFAAKAFAAAAECEVLLKNEGNILPLEKGKKILLTGPNANSMRCLNGGWSYTWQGSNAEDLSEGYNTIYEAFCNRFGANNIILKQGVTYNEKGSWWQENEPRISDAVRAAADADVIVACVGENSYCETPGNLSDLNLSRNQKALVKALAATGKPVILVLNEGRPRLISDIEPLAKAVVSVLLPGNYGGDALAALLAGDVNFSGKLPYTYPKEINSLINYDYKVSEQVSTMAGAYDYDARVVLQWPFGYGLSYTAFSYENLSVTPVSFTADDVLTIKVDVTNTGDRAGKESVLLYSSDLVASMVPDCRRLRAFTKVELQPRETKTVEFQLPASDLAFVGTDGEWILEKGDFVLTTGGLNAPITCTASKSCMPRE